MAQGQTGTSGSQSTHGQSGMQGTSGMQSRSGMQGTSGMRGSGNSGADNATYDLISVAYHALQAVETYHRYEQDASGDQQLQQFFRKVCEDNKQCAQEAIQVLQRHLGGQGGHSMGSQSSMHGSQSSQSQGSQSSQSQGSQSSQSQGSQSGESGQYGRGTR